MSTYPMPGAPLPFEACENFRELGGYTGLDGKRVKAGAFYRTPALADVTTPHDKALLASLGVRLVIDFRSEPERLEAPDPALPGARHVDVCAMLDEKGEDMRFDLDILFTQGRQGIEQVMRMVHESYVRMPFQNPGYRVLFDAIRAGETPILFHCTAGKDRTGVAAALILRALGVSRADILHDYELTNRYRAKTRARFAQVHAARLGPGDHSDAIAGLLGVEVHNLEMSLDAIDARYPDFASYLDAEYGFTAQDLAQMRAAYLV